MGLCLVLDQLLPSFTEQVYEQVCSKTEVIAKETGSWEMTNLPAVFISCCLFKFSYFFLCLLLSCVYFSLGMSVLCVYVHVLEGN